MNRPLLQLNKWSCQRGGRPVLQEVALQIEPGELVGVVGVNAAGKSSLLESIMGFLPRKEVEGESWFEGKSLHALSPAQRARLGLGYVAEGREVFSELSIKEHLRVGSMAAGRRRKASQLTELLEAFPLLRERQNQIAGTLSGGERQLLVLAKALMGQPKLLLLDEPGMGLSPKWAVQIYAHIQRLQSAGRSILLVEQQLTQVLRLADRVYVLAHGKLVGHGKPDDYSEAEWRAMMV